MQTPIIKPSHPDVDNWRMIIQILQNQQSELPEDEMLELEVILWDGSHYHAESISIQNPNILILRGKDEKGMVWVFTTVGQMKITSRKVKKDPKNPRNPIGFNAIK